jgi:hypothetical protein
VGRAAGRPGPARNRPRRPRIPDLQPRHESKRRRVRDWQRWLLRSRSAGARTRAGRRPAGRTRRPAGELLDVDHLRFAFVPRGAFWMGDEGDSKAPLHRNETLDYDYWIAESPVTVAQFAQFVASTGGEAPDPEALRDPPNRPVATVSWHDALAFCAWLRRALARAAAGRLVGRPAVGSRVGESRAWRRASFPSVRSTTTVGQGLRPCRPGTAGRTRNRSAPGPGVTTGSREWVNADRRRCEASTPGCFEAGRSPYRLPGHGGQRLGVDAQSVGHRLAQPAFVYPYDARDLKREDRDAPRNDVFRVVRGGSWNSSSRRRPLRLPSGLSRALGMPQLRFSGGVAFFPCSLTLSSAPSGLCHSGYSDSGGGAGETSPAAPGGYLARRPGIGCAAKRCLRKPQVSA